MPFGCQSPELACEGLCNGCERCQWAVNVKSIDIVSSSCRVPMNWSDLYLSLPPSQRQNRACRLGARTLRPFYALSHLILMSPYWPDFAPIIPKCFSLDIFPKINLTSLFFRRPSSLVWHHHAILCPVMVMDWNQLLCFLTHLHISF